MATTFGKSGKSGKCSNFGNCTLADSRQTIEVLTGLDFVCSECGKTLMASGAGNESASSLKKPAIIGGVLLALVLAAGGVAWSLFGSKPQVASAPAATSTAPDPAAAATKVATKTKVLFRIAGSNTLGSQLVPALAEAYLKNQGAATVGRVVGASPVDVSVQGQMPDGSTQTIDIAAHGSSTGFAGLAGSTADIAMASRRITLAEVTQLAALGDLTSAASEHVVGLDGLAVIVHKSNPVAALTKDQLAKIFTGTTRDWSQLGAVALGKSGPIAVFARDEKSGTYDSFKHMVLDPGKLAPSAQRFEDSGQLSDAVANEPGGIGFIGLPYVRNAKPLRVGDKGAVALLPNRFTVATEDYVLSRRLYLYSAAAPGNPNVTKFIEFAKGNNGQTIVAQQGFIEQTVRAQDDASKSATSDTDQPAQYQQATANATRLSLNFRFRTGSKELDNKAIPDLDRVVTFLADMRTAPGSVMLFGFADSRGPADSNLKLSKERAQAVAAEFTARGIAPALVTGFGAAMPVASNDNAEGQERNRRVEIWVKR